MNLEDYNWMVIAITAHKDMSSCTNEDVMQCVLYKEKPDEVELKRLYKELQEDFNLKEFKLEVENLNEDAN